MKEYAAKFYNSKAWKDCRENYKKHRGYLCERCLARGIYMPGEIVHHINPITADNIDDPNVTLSWSNLQCLCRDCHAQMHSNPKRYRVDELGRIIV